MIKKGSTLAACRMRQLEEALHSRVAGIFLMNASLPDLMDPVLRNPLVKPVFLHMDLVKGLSGDADAVRFLARYVSAVRGVVSTKNHVIRAAKKAGLLAVQRVFLIDTRSLETSIESIRENKPNAIELMPALGASAIPRFRDAVKVPIIVGGLIEEAAQIQEAFALGADAVSFSKKELWDICPSDGTRACP